ncbi:MAG TPA: ATP-binding protein [Thermoanaerobaculia bacterium]|nr:ATP-binding protein [Thermoanaerobaculia bacterium]
MHRSLPFPQPAPGPVPVPLETEGTAPPLHHRSSAAFQSFLQRSLHAMPVDRLIGQFVDSPAGTWRGTQLGALRAALAWRALPAFLASEGWEALGSMSWQFRKETVEIPTLAALRLGESEWLELPNNLFVFLEQGACGEDRPPGSAAKRAVLHLVAFLECSPPHAEIRIYGDADGVPFLERWFAATRRENALRGRSLRADGRLLESEGPAPDWERLFLDPRVRERLDFALRRFAAARDPRLAAAGLRARGGLILAGPPGNGKTSVGRLLAATAPCTFLWATPSDLGDDDAVREVFALARWLAPAILFLEDLDLVAEGRGRGFTSSALGQLMTELDGAPGDHPLFTIATTNRLAVVEEALRNRPGRFDQVLELGPPDDGLRRRFLGARFRDRALAEPDLAWLSRRLDGASGAEIEEVCNAALFLAHEAAPSAPDVPEPVAVLRPHLEEALGLLRRKPDNATAGFGTGE